MTKYSIFFVCLSACLCISSLSGAENRRCGNFSDSELDNLKSSISIKGHEYRITSEKFIDGWRKLAISAYDDDEVDELNNFKTLVSIPIFQCLCGFLAINSYLYTNLEN